MKIYTIHVSATLNNFSTILFLINHSFQNLINMDENCEIIEIIPSYKGNDKIKVHGYLMIKE